ncbi:MAG: class B sortase [Oscillospiraceae bacterium]|nr:class B sortase [Oscillospiraceae bacterium]
MLNQRVNAKKPKPKDIRLKDLIYEFVEDDSPDEFIDNISGDIDRDPFLHSLETLAADDIAEAPPKKKKSVNDIIFNTIRNLLLLICVGVFVVSGYQLVDSLIGYWRTDQIYSSFASMFYEDMDFEMESFNGEYAFSGELQLSPALLQTSTTPNYERSIEMSGVDILALENNVEVQKYNPQLERLKAQLNNYANKYPDFFGMIKIPGTEIDYPVMQSKDNDYYLNHAWDGSRLPAGAIFADYRNERAIMKNFNTILYGHNVKSGAMFNNVTKYLDEEFFYKNKYIELSTTTGIYTYEIFSIHKASFDDDYIKTGFATYDEFVEFCYKLQNLSLYNKNMDFSWNDHILTLSTCTNVLQSERYALHAKHVKTIK